MEKCRFCNGKNIIKKGIIRGKQRYKCKDCQKCQVEKDGREKYDKKHIFLALSMRFYGSGLRQIANTLSMFLQKSVSYQIVNQWIDKENKKTEDEVANAQKTEQNIEILEMDELYTYIKKNQKLLANKENPRRKLEFGLLLIGTKWKLLHFISDQEPKLQPKEYWKS